VIAGALRLHPAVSSARWRQQTRSLTVQFDPAVSFRRIVAELEAQDHAPAQPEEVSSPGWRDFIRPGAALLAGLTGLGGPVAATIIAASGLPILRRALGSLRENRLNIDVLDAAAVVLMLGTGDVLAAGVSVGLIEGSERIRHRAAGRARHAIRSWMGMSPAGIRVRRNGSEPRVPAEEVTVGDRVVVYPGDSIPVDGVITSGSGSLDTRTWTGEALPREVLAGGAVLAGSTLVDGRIVVEVTATGDETRAGRLSAALEEALAANTQVSDLALRVANRFVLPVITASALVFALTRQMQRVIAMLIVDFGTGVRVAIPTTVLATMVAGVRQGVLFKSGRAVEELAMADVVVFDKTGTLTSGEISVLGITPADSQRPSDVLRWAAAAEGHVPHPIASAIRRAARREGLDLPEPEWLRYHTGGGVEAVVEGHRLLIGDHRLLEAQDVRIPSVHAPQSLAVHVAIDGRYAARIRLRDALKTSAAGAMQRLRHLGVKRIWLASGDHRSTVGAISRQLGLDGYGARLMPEDKVTLVRRFREQGHRVAVVGDGINDAPAMAEANVSVAVPRGADLAREAADIVLLTEDLDDLITAVSLARSAMGLVRQNIGLVAVPNSAGMLLATAGRLSPLMATIFNNGSTILAGVNGLRPLAGGRQRR
jgi:Cu2+-exporting ATPase